MLLAHRVAVVTGGASGIGAAICRLFTQQGCRVVLADLQKDKGSALAKELGADRALFVPCDVTREGDVEAALVAAVDAFGDLSIMVNNAGVVGAMGPIDQMAAADFQRTLDINLLGVFHGIKHAARAMKAANTGTIINTCSVAGLGTSGAFASAGYTASKTAVAGLTKLAACELAPWGITVNAIAPGPTATPMIGSFLLGDATMPLPAVEAALAQSSPVKGRSCTAGDIANSALFLASGQGQAMNGQTLVVDLGLTAGVTGQVPPMSQLQPKFLDEAGQASGAKFPGLVSSLAPPTPPPN